MTTRRGGVDTPVTDVDTAGGRGVGVVHVLNEQRGTNEQVQAFSCAAPLVRQLWPPLRHWAWGTMVRVALPLRDTLRDGYKSASGVDGEKLSTWRPHESQFR